MKSTGRPKDFMEEIMHRFEVISENNYRILQAGEMTEEIYPLSFIMYDEITTYSNLGNYGKYTSYKPDADDFIAQSSYGKMEKFGIINISDL